MFEKIIRYKYFGLIALSFILVAGFLVRLYKINNPIADWHSWRQADTASVTRFFVKDGPNLLLPRYHDISSIQTGIFNPNGYRMVELPIYNLVSSLLIKQFPAVPEDVWSRLVTIFASLLTAYFLFLIANKQLNLWGGLLAAFFYLFIPFNIFFTRVILPDPLGVMFSVASIWFFIKFIEKDKIAILILSSSFFAMSLLIKPYLAFYLIPIVYLAIDKYGLKNLIKNKKVFKYLIVFTLVSFLPFVFYRIWESQFPEGIPFYKWAFNGNGIRFKPSFWYWIFGQRLSHLILGGLGVIPFVFGVLNTKNKNLFVNFCLLGGFLYVVFVATANVMHDYYQIPIIPVVSLSLASGFLFLWNSEIFNRVLSRSVLVVSVFVMLITGWNLIKDNYNINHPEIIEAGKRVDEITPKDAIIVAPYNGDTAFLYQTKRSGWPAIDDSIDNIIDKGASYFVSVNFSDKDTIFVSSRFKIIEKTEKYIIVDLKNPIKSK